MPDTQQLSRVTPYLSRLLSDEYVQEQIGQALTDLRCSARRAKGRRADDALADARLRRKLVHAIKSLGNARQALVEPPPKRHRLKGALLLAVPVGTALAWQRRASSHTH